MTLTPQKPHATLTAVMKPLAAMFKRQHAGCMQSCLRELPHTTS